MNWKKSLFNTLGFTIFLLVSGVATAEMYIEHYRAPRESLLLLRPDYRSILKCAETTTIPPDCQNNDSCLKYFSETGARCRAIEKDLINSIIFDNLNIYRNKQTAENTMFVRCFDGFNGDDAVNTYKDNSSECVAFRASKTQAIFNTLLEIYSGVADK